MDEIVHAHTKPVAKTAARKDSSPMEKNEEEEMDSKSSDEEISSGGGGNYYQDDEDEKDEDDAKAAASATNDPHSIEDEMSYKSSEEDSSFHGDRYDQDDEDYEYEEDDTSNDQTVDFKASEEEDDDDEESRFNQDQTAPNTTAVHQESNQENDEDVSDLEHDVNGVAVSSNQKDSDGSMAFAAGNQATAMAHEIEELKSKLVAKGECEAALRAELEAKSDELETSHEENIRLRGEICDLKAEAITRRQAQGVTRADQDELHRLRRENEEKKRIIDDLASRCGEIPLKCCTKVISMSRTMANSLQQLISSTVRSEVCVISDK